MTRLLQFRTWATIALPLVLCAHLLLFYALPLPLLGFVVLCLAILFALRGPAKAMLLTGALVLATGGLELTLRFTNADLGTYYRPDELFGYYDDLAGHVRYTPRVRTVMQAPHGDLKAIHPAAGVAPDPRRIVFESDTLGFRNREDYQGQPYLLVGDSFIAGSGLSQEDLIGEQLQTTYHIATYSLGSPAAIPTYCRMIDTFDRAYGQDARIVLFLFEGNDFLPESSHSRSMLEAAVDGVRAYGRLFKRARLFRFTFWRQKSWFRSRQPPDTVRTLRVGGADLAFYVPYMEATESTSIQAPEPIIADLSGIRNRLAHIYLIPTKYRVYYSLQENPPTRPLPHAAWDCVQEVGRQMNVPVTDLTEPLVRESARLLQEGQFTFWRDDTHWNGNGTRIAAQCVAATLEASRRPPVD